MELLALKHNVVTYKPSSGANSNELSHRMRVFGRLEVNFRESEL